MHPPQFSLAARMGLAFFSLVVLAAGLGGFSLLRMDRIRLSASETDQRWLPSITAVNDLRTAANRVRRTEADLLLAPAVRHAAVEKKLDDYDADYRKRDAAYQARLAPGAEREAFTVYARERDRWLAAQERLRTLASGADAAEARAWYDGESRAGFDAMIVGLRTLADINEKGSKAAAQYAGETYAASIRETLALLGMIVAVAAALAAWIVRGITRQLGAEPAQATALAQRVADGDLSGQIVLRRGDDASLMAALARMQGSLARIAREVRTGAEGVATASGQIAQGTGDLSGRTEQQASALEQTSASMKELGATVDHNAASAQEGSRLASEACGVAERGGAVVRQVVQTMKGIDGSSRRIAQILSVIDGIAFQTNILALNAAVEAARAGEQGRGFAVVAGEVRTLAQRSADAAKEIKGLIADSVQRVGEGSALADQAGRTMDEVVQAIAEVARLTAAIAAASRQQSEGVAQVGEAVRQMDTTTQQNAALVEQSAAACGSLQAQARQLVDAVAVFRLAN